MISAYISIGLNNGKKVIYVRNKVDKGKDGEYYLYGGPGYQEVSFEGGRKINRKFNLVRGEEYSFKLEIDGSEKTYTIIPREKEKENTLFAIEERDEVDFFEVINLLNRATLKDGARWSETSDGSIRCTSLSVKEGTAILISKPDDGGAYLFDALDGTVEDAVAGDALQDQNESPGQVLHDLNSMLGFINKQKNLPTENEEEKLFLEFPEEGGNVDVLFRRNNSDNMAYNTQIATSVPINAISEITIVEKHVPDTFERYFD